VPQSRLNGHGQTQSARHEIRSTLYINELNGSKVHPEALPATGDVRKIWASEW
jgi:hypothetical protein